MIYAWVKPAKKREEGGQKREREQRFNLPYAGMNATSITIKKIMVTQKSIRRHKNSKKEV